MPKQDSRVDAYIHNSPDFARPILKHLRTLVHRACPEVEETIKWGFPNFMLQGPLCNMAAFKQHCAFNFWKAAILPDPQKILSLPCGEGMGHLGRIMTLKDLPPDTLMLSYLREAAKLNKTGVKVLRPKATPEEKKTLKVPGFLMAALRKHKEAGKAFEAFSYSHKKEYLEWLTEAKTEETRVKRLATAMEWMAEGKPRNWKYMKRV